MNHRERVELLERQGVRIPAPESVEIGEEVQLEQVHGPDTVLHGGTKLYGERLLIEPGCRLGYEEPVTVENCAVGPRCKLNGGSFSEAVFLEGAVFGKGAQVREGTLLEEEANAAHTVGLKQTVLLPFVTLGSLINFCDVLMAGGTSRRDHSEVGSSFIHFNFTPFGRQGDKATPSLIGDVPRGVMLRERRIFLGGQGGLVGPVHIDYGTVTAAGFVYRHDHGPDELVVAEKLVPRVLPFAPLRYGRIREKVGKNLTYLGNLIALWHWYERVRLPFAGGGTGQGRLWRRAQQVLESGIAERVKRLGQVAGYMEDSIRELERDDTPNEAEIATQRAFAAAWPALEQQLLAFRTLEAAAAFAPFGEGLARARAASYLELIRGLDPATVNRGTDWLQELVHRIEALFGAPGPEA